MDDEKYMAIALELAARARGRTSPNPLVGAVVVKDGRIVGQGYHEKAGTPHAEVHALREAGEQAMGATIYVTLEPCSHYGRTPPCSEAVINAGVARCVAAMVDPNPLVAGRGLDQIRQAGIEVSSGVLEEEAHRLNEVFIKYITTKEPFVVMKSAMTLDGKIATHTGHSRWVTGPEARERVHRLRDEYDAIMVGVGTILADDPALTTRLTERGRDPVRIILDSQARTPLTAKILNQHSQAATIIAVTQQAPQQRVAALEQAGAKVLTVPDMDGRVDIKRLMSIVGQEGITGILLEGGGQVNGAALAAGIVDKVIWFIAPKLIGGQTAPTPIGGPGATTMDEALNLTRVKLEQLGPDIMIEGYIQTTSP
ncbi:MAG: bifunctional diaminohydroxyphosphoribosylaminopyrimidine deaminase/5-amino-6-(5-phosphoribosylamino)uracil reductase RibD [Clostridia bacterium]|nr:bifunctional diaminohydroxyphosphoribosylaminopyrimidine deaminase/5-amino-6-(5-phosphoribosylamino)uracil reductase RibD [Clostridia bacterium]